MKRIATILFFCLLHQVPLAWATSTISFEGDKYYIEVVVSNTNNSVANVRIYQDEALVLSVEGRELRKASCSLEKQTLRFTVPAKKSRKKIEFNAVGDHGILVFEGERIPLQSDWLH